MDTNELSVTHVRLNELLTTAGLEPLSADVVQQFDDHLSLIVRWNSRVNLTAVRDEGGILSRHFLECIACARSLPPKVRTLLDFGSGAGLPGIPIALCRAEIAVTLAESKGKKAAFLAEAARVLKLRVQIHAGRAEDLNVTFDCVILRAVDKMADAVRAAAAKVASGGLLALMTTDSHLAGLQRAAGESFLWEAKIRLPGSESRLLSLGRKSEITELDPAVD